MLSLSFWYFCFDLFPFLLQKCSEPSNADKADPAATTLSNLAAEEEDYDFDEEDGNEDGGSAAGAGADDVFETVFDVLHPDDDKMRSLLEAAAQKEENMSTSSGECKRQRIE